MYEALQRLWQGPQAALTITMILAFGVTAAMRAATYGRQAWTGQASKHIHCAPGAIAKRQVRCQQVCKV